MSETRFTHWLGKALALMCAKFLRVGNTRKLKVSRNDQCRQLNSKHVYQYAIAIGRRSDCHVFVLCVNVGLYTVPDALPQL